MVVPAPGSAFPRGVEGLPHARAETPFPVRPLARRMSDHELITRRLCLIKDTGHAGVLWGGNMMAWVDEAGAIYAGRQVKNRFMVTKAFTEIDFQSRVGPGDMVSFYGRVARWGRTSLSIDLRVTATHPSEDAEREVLSVTGVFVAIDDDGTKQTLIPAHPQ